ncbi:MAG: flavodoxin family protein [Pseudomonadota bacterium]
MKRTPKIVIIFHSSTGTTKRLAHAIAKGVDNQQLGSSQLIEIIGQDIQHGRYLNQATLSAITEADAVIWGSPTYMGSVSAQFKSFADATGDVWDNQLWAGKLAAGFTIGANYCGDQLMTLQYMQVLASQHGMIWIGLDIAGGQDTQGRNRLGTQIGLASQTRDTDVPDIDLITAEYLGGRVARALSFVLDRKL